MPTIEEMEDEIEEAEQAVAADPDRVPIVDTRFEATHGYVKPGEEPVACTPALKPTINDVVADDGTITAMFPAENDGEHEGYEHRTFEPGDDEYIELLDELIQPGYRVVTDVE